MKASELIEKLEKAIAKVGDVDIKGIGNDDDFLGGVSLCQLRNVLVTNRGDIVISSYNNHDDCYYKFEEIE